MRLHIKLILAVFSFLMHLQSELISQEYYFSGGFFYRFGHYELSTSQDCVVNDVPFCELSNIYTDIYRAYILLTFTPESSLVCFSQEPPLNPDHWVYCEIDLATGDTSHIYEFDTNNFVINGAIASVGNGMFYSMEYLDDDHLYLINTNNGTVADLGPTGYPNFSDLTLFNGEMYYFSGQVGGEQSLVHLDLSQPSNSSVVYTLPFGTYIYYLTASPFCNFFLGYGHNSIGTYYASLISAIDGAMIPVCEATSFHWSNLTSMLEFADQGECENILDLDCNDSSGATGADYNASPVTCHMRQAPVADEDVRMFYDDWISEMTIRVTGFVPDGLDEVIDISGSVPGINVDGQGTDVLTLSNAGGARSTDFIDALHLVHYANHALSPTNGLRTIEVQFTTASGGMSNVAAAYIQVQELQSLDVDLGPDQFICESGTVTLDAGAFSGATYTWSGGQMSQMITVSQDGEYSVTVSDDTHCPGSDTVTVVTVPVITVALTGDVLTCDNETVTLTLQTNASFPITVEIEADPGETFVFDDVIGTYSFTDLPFSNTIYTITSVTPSMDACITVTDPVQEVSVFPSYVHAFDVSMCDGDSLWMGFYWETEAGIYEYTLSSIHGCDSVVTTTITILPAVMIQVQEDTCDASAVGVYITTIDNPNGCDTVVTTTISLIPSDTTEITLSTCVWSDVSIHIDTLTNMAGCDSLIINQTVYIPPGDTTRLTEMTCDSSLLGIFYDTLTATTDCDSIVERIVTYSLTDTTYQSGTSCIPGQIGMFETWYTDAQGCDSLVITTVTMGVGDTTMVHLTSCDSSDVGVMHYAATGVDGCDSLIITTVTFAAQDSVWITGSSCNSADTGVFVSQYTNQFGCDSIVTETITLLPSDVTSISSTTCDPSSTGIFVTTLSNQYGCDSIVTETVVLIGLMDTTYLFVETCDPAQTGVVYNTAIGMDGCDSIVITTTTLTVTDTTFVFLETCDPAQTGVVYNATTGMDGCDSLVIETTTLFPLPQLTLQSLFDYNGYGISCEGDADGGAIVEVNGVGPFSYLWSTNDSTQTITGLSVGDYDVAITDVNGCMTDGTVTLTAPDAFMIGFEVSEPDCFDQQLGSITVVPSGGVAPFTYSIDGTVFQASPVFTGLEEGIYQITSLDANDCSAMEIISIDVPLMVNVELGDNQSISIGDSVLLEAIINLPFDSLASVMWTGIDSIGCANCLTQIVAPIITTAYSISVTSADGCADRDSVTVQVTTDHKLYIPNIFSPNGDGINDVVMISADDGVREISSFSIFDRWGNLVFAADHFQPNDPTISWDGKLHGEAMNPGVFTYRVIIVYVTGETEVRYGDLTLIR
jgi:gliding motility-associated-like protein